LARKAGGPDFGMGDISWVNISDVLLKGHVRPMAAQHPPAKIFLFTQENGFQVRSLKA
jgi:hypothetical protein